MDGKKILSEILSYYKYKVDNDLCTPEEMDSACKVLQENMEMYGTIEDFAKFFGVSESNVRAVISRKVLDKPKRRVFYRFQSLLKNAPASWRNRGNNN